MSYRVVVRHVRYWRGVVHRWSTVYQYLGTASVTPDPAACDLMTAADSAMCYGNVAGDGGVFETQIYDQASGGVPIATRTYFDYAVPGDWIPYTHTAWTTTGGAGDGEAETALQVEWNAGLSKSGKPVKLRKWYHAVPAKNGGSAAAQVPPADVTSLESGAVAITGALAAYGLVLGSASGRFAGSPTVSGFYGNHQMPRGRRRSGSSSPSLSGAQILQLLESQALKQAQAD